MTTRRTFLRTLAAAVLAAAANVWAPRAVEPTVEQIVRQHLGAYVAAIMAEIEEWLQTLEWRDGKLCDPAVARVVEGFEAIDRGECVELNEWIGELHADTR